MSRYQVIAALLVLTPSAVIAQEAGEAAALFAAGDWAGAAEAYERAVDADPQAGLAWYRLGVASHRLGRSSRALAALERAAASDFARSPPGSRAVPLELARVHAGRGDAGAALTALETAAAAGLRGPRRLRDDEALAALAGESRFEAILATVRGNTFPCEQGEAWHAFDFWLGEWEVHTADGSKAGDNSITRAENGCVLIERWTSVTGGTGRSMNYFDPRRDQWAQLWIDASGSIVDISGGVKDGSMVLTGTIHYTGTGRTADFRGRWTPLDDGRVRQFFEESDDDGESWSPWFEGFYTRRP